MLQDQDQDVAAQGLGARLLGQARLVGHLELHIIEAVLLRRRHPRRRRRRRRCQGQAHREENEKQKRATDDMPLSSSSSSSCCSCCSRCSSCASCSSCSFIFCWLCVVYCTCRRLLSFFLPICLSFFPSSFSLSFFSIFRGMAWRAAAAAVAVAVAWLALRTALPMHTPRRCCREAAVPRERAGPGYDYARLRGRRRPLILTDSVVTQWPAYGLWNTSFMVRSATSTLSKKERREERKTDRK